MYLSISTDPYTKVDGCLFYIQGLCQEEAYRNKYVQPFLRPLYLVFSPNPMIESTAVETLQTQFSGYGSTSKVVARCLDRMNLKEPLEEWSNETISKVVVSFIDEKFPTVIALNKIDHPDSDKVSLTASIR